MTTKVQYRCSCSLVKQAPITRVVLAFPDEVVRLFCDCGALIEVAVPGSVALDLVRDGVYVLEGGSGPALIEDDVSAFVKELEAMK